MSAMSCILKEFKSQVDNWAARWGLRVLWNCGFTPSGCITQIIWLLGARGVSASQPFAVLENHYLVWFVGEMSLIIIFPLLFNV